MVDSSNLADGLLVKDHSIFFKVKNIFRNRIVAADIVATFCFVLVFGLLYLFNASKLNDSVLVSPIQKPTKATLPANTNRYFSQSSNAQKQVIGFLPSWMVSQNVEVDTKKLTEIIYFGLGVNDNGELIQYDKEQKPTFEWLYFTSDYFSNIRTEAKKNNTKVLVAFKMFDNESIDNLISNSVSTEFFIKNALNILKKYDLDGINLDFEYFTDSNFPTVRYMNSFLETLSTALKNENPKYLLSVDINATVMLSDKAYDLVKMGETTDQIIVMAYDYRNPSSLFAGPVSPIDGEFNEHSIRESISSLVGRAPSEKVILAVPFYGYEWETVSDHHKSSTIPNSGALATYKRVRELLKTRSDIVKGWDSKAMSPWLTYEQSGAIKQIYYEDERSITAKTEFVKNNNLGGLAIWAIGYEGKYNELWETILKASN